MEDYGDTKAGAPKGAPGAGEDAAARVTALEAELAKVREEARQHQERWLRERAETMKFANESLLRDLLPIVDNLERAVARAESGGDGQPLVEGVALVLKSLLDVLERHGVKRIEAKGTPFDPAQHEAMAHVESAEHEPNSVIEEHQPGYRLQERLLRPALVSVAKAPDPNLARDKDRD